ncbi:MAG: AbrB/MazE/SpoVT family DNA-binding domain-containing protein [Bacillota bacterium]
MLRTRVTSKGQITVPAAVRQKLNVKPGDDLLFEVENGEARVRVIQRKRLTELYASLPAKRPYPGKDGVRREVAEEVARRILRKGQKERKE